MLLLAYSMGWAMQKYYPKAVLGTPLNQMFLSDIRIQPLIDERDVTYE